MSKTKHATDIELTVSPLGEVWLEVRWKLQPMKLAGQAQDPDFLFALGPFYKLVHDRYKVRKDLDASQAPLDIFPYVVRHQFWADESTWPVLQLGPGIATVNFTKPYSWSLFRSEARFLLENLLEAYGGKLPATESITLRYQNYEPFDYLSLDVVSFLSAGLNTKLQLPVDVPGAFAARPFPSGLKLQASFDLKEPTGKATLLISTAERGFHVAESSKGDTQHVVVWQFEVASQGDGAPAVSQLASVMQWLDAAHAAIHEWFFSFIEDKLFQQYGGKQK